MSRWRTVLSRWREPCEGLSEELIPRTDMRDTELWPKAMTLGLTSA